MTDLQRTIDVDPFRVVINLMKEFDPEKSDKVIGYRATANITRFDGKPVYKTFLGYRIDHGDAIADRLQAIADAESRAREAINNGFPG